MSKRGVAQAVPVPERSDVTILDIARELDISHSTVSRALAGHAHISPETKQRVNQAALRLGYVPHASARTMRGGASSVVGLFIPDVQNDFYATVAKIVADALAANSMQLMLAVTEDNPDREQRELRALLEARPAGIIIVMTAAPRPETLKMLRGIKSVELLRTHAHPTANTVLVDDRAGTFAAANHLLNYGHRRIAYIGGTSELSTGRERLAGFEDALRERQVPAADIALGLPRPQFARHAIASMMARKDRPTGLVLGSAELTLGALQGLRAAGLEWPRDVSIVGYHDPAWFELVGPGITTVRLPVQDIALTATNVLLARIKDGKESAGPISEPIVVRFGPSLILRGSTAVVAS
jgi:LacI family transcriptional regulator